MLHILIRHLSLEDKKSGYKFNVFEVFMLKSAPSSNSFAGIQVKHALGYNINSLK